MGWDSGAQVMSGLIEVMVKHVPDKEKRKAVYRDIIPVLQSEDWDTESDCLDEDEAYDEVYDELFPPEDE